MEAPVLEAHVGRVLAGKYRLDARLRAGAMGAIYRAHHLTLEKAVCIKIMHPELAKDPQFAERFHREARAASRIDHPSSIMILDYGADSDGTLYIAMELVEGRDLYDLIDEAARSGDGMDRVFPVRRIVDLMSQTLAAVAAAHDGGILHRDLKPENIMVAPSWDDASSERVKVCDFGIAHIDEPPAAESGRRLTRKGLLLGTPEYMSPEQARADAVDARSDIYSAGVLLYQLLTGRVPFQDDSAIGVALMQINADPTRPSDIDPAVDPALEAICLKALQKNPAERFQSARAMRAALRELSGAPCSTPIPPLQTQSTAETQAIPLVNVVAPRPSPRRSRALAIVSAGMVALGFAGFFALRSSHTALAASEAPAAARADVVARSAPPLAVFAASEPAIALTAVVAPTQPVATADRPAPLPIMRRRAVTAAIRAPSVADTPIAAATAVPIPEPTATPEPVAPPPPIVTQAPPPPPPVTAPPPPPAASPTPAYALDTAHVDIGAPQTVGATSASVDRALAPVRPRIDACYRAALPHLSVDLAGAGALHLETDDVGTIRRATVTGALAGDVGPCIVKSVVGRRVANVDTGEATADVPLSYRAR